MALRKPYQLNLGRQLLDSAAEIEKVFDLYRTQWDIAGSAIHEVAFHTNNILSGLEIRNMEVKEAYGFVYEIPVEFQLDKYAMPE